MTRRRRSYDWLGIAANARAHPGVWRLHSHLVAVTPHLHRHAVRRVPVLRPTASGHFEFRRANIGPDPLGRPVFDLRIRWVPATKEKP